jgi:hypothetical protein
MEYCEFENRIMSDDPASVADDQEIGRGDAASVTNDEEIGMSYGMRGDIVLDSALNMLNLILPWQQTKEQPKEEKDEIILEAASLGDTSTTADARRIRDTSRVGERAGPIQKASRPPSGAMFLQSTAPSAPAPSVDETQDRAAQEDARSNVLVETPASVGLLESPPSSFKLAPLPASLQIPRAHPQSYAEAALVFATDDGPSPAMFVPSLQISVRPLPVVASRPPSPAMFVQSTAPSAPAPSVDETQDRAATTRAPETPPQVSGGGALTTSMGVGISTAAPVQHYNI